MFCLNLKGSYHDVDTKKPKELVNENFTFHLIRWNMFQFASLAKITYMYILSPSIPATPLHMKWFLRLWSFLMDTTT